MSAITALTAQNTVEVRAVELASPELVAAQIDAVFDDLGVDAVKVGMLGARPLVEVVADRLAGRAGLPLVVDPVMIAASGARLLDHDAVASLRERLAPLATLLTPNLPEAEVLTGRSARDLAACRDLARSLGELAPAVLLKGGHAAGEELVDLLWDGSELHEIRHARLASRAGHGTGCSLSAAIAARLGRGEALLDACRGAIDWLAGAIANAAPLGHGVGPVDVLWQLRSAGAFA